MDDHYFIKSGYRTNIEEGRPKVVYTEAPKGTHFQIAVYRMVREYIKRHGATNVVDLGCGSGYKLNRYIANLGIPVYGVDQHFAIEEGKKQYPLINWIEEDFATEDSTRYDKFDVIICADVIEHLVNPDILIKRIQKSSHENSMIFISTPERDLVRGRSDFGPPANPRHVREWNFAEFEQYIADRGLNVIDHKVLPAKKMTIRETWENLLGRYNNKTCQLVVCKLMP